MVHVDEFVYVLIAAFIILAVLFAISPLITTPPEAEVSNKTVAEFALGSVGLGSSAATRTVHIGSFIAGVEQLEIIKSIPEIEVSAGVLSSAFVNETVNVEKEILDVIDKIIVEFVVSDTNLLESLGVKWNGKEVFNKRADVGPHRITIDKENILPENVLEIATTATWQFWASTVYKLEDLRIDQEYGVAKLIPFQVSGPELESFDKGELTLFVSKKPAEGSLVIKVNGAEVFDNYPNTIEKVVFTLDDAVLRVGRNLLSFSAKDGVFGLSDVRLELFSLSVNTVEERSFELSGDEYKMVEEGEGRVEIDVESIPRYSDLEVKINDKTVVVKPKEGLNTLSFSNADVNQGTNTIKFSTTGNIEIGSVKIVVEKAES